MPLILPDAARTKRLRSINALLNAHKESPNVEALGKAVKLMLEEPAFQKFVQSDPKQYGPVSDADDLMKYAWGFFYHLMFARDHVAAAMMMWDVETFTPEPHCVQLVWEALKTKRMIGIIGGGGLGKTYSSSAFFLLEWALDPEWTRFQVASASEDHLRKNLYADIVRLHQGASLPLPGTPDTEAISLDKKRAQGIFTLVLPGGPQSKGKLQGSHTKPRPHHPLFGRRSRVFTIIDEAQEVPQNIYAIIPNRFSTVVGDDVEHLKFVVCANPKDSFSEFGKCMKPKAGWESITRADETWLSEEGWSVVSLDATKHENVIQKRQVYPGFVSWHGVYIIWLQNRCHGDPNDPQLWTYVYGKFPPQGLTGTIIKTVYIQRAEKDWIFSSIAENLGGHDVAFTGDNPTFAAARVGMAIGWLDSDGTRHDLPEPALKIQVDATEIMAHDPDTQIHADANMSRCKDLGIKPPHYGIDKTGAGRGVYDLIRRQWRDKVNGMDVPPDQLANICGIEYAESPSEVKVADEDTATPKELYDRMASELWFAAAKLFEYDVVALGRGVSLAAREQLAARCGGMKTGLGKKLTVESKDAYKKRTGSSSPDEADSVLIVLHVARVSIPGLIPKAKGTTLVREAPARGWRGFDDPVFAGAEMDGFDRDLEPFADTVRD